MGTRSTDFESGWTLASVHPEIGVFSEVNATWYKCLL